ncbi:profilin-2-like [Phyllopteryx taeniolatus]|uniref:profilin-2-like n=1 Tax=Phyllopteryx taeniolatus TaxID=161469 RepID=UPI002AD5A698|nr:profilin-2-like [Phyllopteryx taeniolatus]
MSWKSYVDKLMDDGLACQDAAIVGYRENPYVWASYCGGKFGSITSEEIDTLTKDRSSLFINGLTIGNIKCSVIRDGLDVDGDWTMDLRTKDAGGGPTYNITIGKSGKALVFAMGNAGVHGGKLQMRVHDMADHLRKAGY